MQIFVDADACPVVDIVEVIVVGAGVDAVDDKENKKPVIKASICNGEQVAGFKEI